MMFSVITTFVSYGGLYATMPSDGTHLKWTMIKPSNQKSACDWIVHKLFNEK